MKDVWIYIIFLLIMGIITVVLYGIDKNRARKKRWRINEATLLLFTCLGGSLGALLGIYGFRHKTKHWYFIVIAWLSFLLQIGVFLFI